MKAVMKAQWMKEKRKPYLILLFIGLSILATIIFGDTSEFEEQTVPIFSNEANAEEIESKWSELLNEEDSSMKFVITDEEQARADVSEGRRNAAVQLMEDDYQLIVASDLPYVLQIEQLVQQVFTKEAWIQAATGGESVADARDEINQLMEDPPVQVETRTTSGDEFQDYNMGMQLLFGFSLFIVMFTIGFKVNGINNDKVNGIWDRLILSPVSKSGMYAGHLLYSFLVGIFQLTAVFLIFRYLMGYDFENMWMILTLAAVFTLSMVSVAMLIAGMTKTPEKFYMIYPSVIPIIPIISGVYMPPGTLTNPIITFIGDLFPLSHAVEAMMGVSLYNYGWTDLTLPIALMLLIGVICMGIGINMVERGKN